MIDAREDAAWEWLLGLRRYQRALLAVAHAGLEAWLWVRPERLAEAEAWAGEGRVAFQVTSETGELPPWSRVSGAACFDATTAASIASGEGLNGFFYPPDAPGAAAALLRSLEGTGDGLVDTYLNRPLSRLLTRALVGTGISPNAVTLVACAVALSGVGLIASRRYEAALAGALLFQLSAVLDCVDGELARLTYRFSPLGARLDLALDNLAHVLLFLALGWASAPRLGLELALGLGVSAALGAAIGFALVYRLTFRLPERARSARTRALLERLANRDVSLLVVLACAWGRPELLLGVIALGTHVFWLLLAWASRRRRLSETSVEDL